MMDALDQMVQPVLLVENVTGKDLVWHMPLNKKSETLSTTCAAFVTSAFWWINFYVCKSKFDERKCHIGINCSDELMDNLKKFDQIVVKHLQCTFPGKEVVPWIKTQPYFHPARKEGNGPPQLIVEEVNDSSWKHLLGMSAIRDKIHNQHLYAKLEFEVFYVYQRDNKVGYMPKLNKLFLMDTTQFYPASF